MSEINFEKYAKNETKTLFYKIGLIGPSRVGKTSIIAALLQEAKDALAQTSVSIDPFVDEDGISPTKDRIRNTIIEIEAGLDFTTFKPTPRGTVEPFIFDLKMEIANQDKTNATQVRFAVLDYPGGWLKKPPQEDEQKRQWVNCQEWIKDSSVIIVPIDANLIMEIENQETSKAARELLQIGEVETLVEKWAKGRFSKGESGLLLLVPVKCETYFNDNGGQNDQSEKLYKQIENFYDQVIEAAEREMKEKEEGKKETSQPHRWRRIVEYSKKVIQNAPMENTPTYAIEYHPIDTIGCIELKEAKWEEDQDQQLSLECEYLVRSGQQGRPKRKPLGTIGLLSSICKQIVENRQNGGIFTKFWDLLRSKDKLMANAINKLSEKENSSRYKEIGNGNIAKGD